MACSKLAHPSLLSSGNFASAAFLMFWAGLFSTKDTAFLSDDTPSKEVGSLMVSVSSPSGSICLLDSNPSESMMSI